MTNEINPMDLCYLKLLASEEPNNGCEHRRVMRKLTYEDPYTGRDFMGTNECIYCGRVTIWTVTGEDRQWIEDYMVTDENGETRKK
jgi:hypothetical protein